MTPDLLVKRQSSSSQAASTGEYSAFVRSLVRNVASHAPTSSPVTWSSVGHALSFYFPCLSCPDASYLCFLLLFKAGLLQSPVLTLPPILPLYLQRPPHLYLSRHLLYPPLLPRPTPPRPCLPRLHLLPNLLHPHLLPHLIHHLLHSPLHLRPPPPLSHRIQPRPAPRRKYLPLFPLLGLS